MMHMLRGSIPPLITPFRDDRVDEEVNQAVFYDTNPIPVKHMMKRMGLLPSNAHRLPLVPPTLELERRLDAVLERAGFLTAAV